MYSDIVAATQPYNLAVPWGDADTTGEPPDSHPVAVSVKVICH